MTILENKQNNEYNYTVLLKNGFSRELTTTPTIYDEGNRHMKFPKTDGDVLISENNYKFGVEELKTGKVIIKHEYDDIYSYDEDTYVAKKDGSYNVYNSKTNTKLFNKDYKIIYKINNNSYMVLNENKVQVINEKEKIISKNNFEVKEVCKNSYMQRGYRAYEQDGKYHIDICASDKIDKNGVAIGSYEAELNYKYDLKTRKFEGIINYNWSE